MKRYLQPCYLALAMLGMSSLPSLAENDHYCRAPASTKDHAAPMNYPDQFAWQLFLEVNQKAKKEYATLNGKKVELNNAVWETWIDDSDNFPQHPNPANPPVWPTKADGHNLAYTSFSHQTYSNDKTSSEPDCNPDDLKNGGTCEVVYRNKATFEYIKNNNLWYQEGIADYVKTGKEIVFPIDSIEVKGNWKLIKENEKKDYHWNYTTKGQLIGLVAMHISSKVIPNWLWATFEHVDNPGRCDLLGCYDCYGVTNPVTQPNAKTFGSVYPEEPLSSALLKQYDKSGFNGTWLKEWKNYRLKGSMINFTDSYGNASLLGNSVTESGFVATSSCMGCHSRAAVTSAGQKAFPFFGELPSTAAIGNIPAEYGLQFLTANGAPNPADFYHRAGNLNNNNPYGTLQFLQTDFVWAIPMRAKSINQTTP